VHLLVKRNFDAIKIHGTTIKRLYFTKLHSLVYNIYCTDYIYKYLYTHKIRIDVRNYVCVLYNAARNVVLNLRSANC